MNLDFLAGDDIRPSDARDLQRVINPNTYLVIHLEPWLRDELYGRRWASLETYDKVAYKFVANVSRDVLGKTAYRKRPRDRKRLPNLVTFEHQGASPHINICIRRPDHWSLEAFTKLCMAHREIEPWFRRGLKTFYCEQRTGNCGTYSLKVGATILKRSMSFNS